MSDFISITLNDEKVYVKDKECRDALSDTNEQVSSNTFAVSILRNTQEEHTGDIETLKNNCGDINTRVGTVEQRMNELESSTTPSGSELIDIRVGANGVTYQTAGDAVRGQYSELYNIHRLLNISESEEINTSELWESGAIENVHGTNVGIYDRLRTKYYLDDNISWVDLGRTDRGMFVYGYDDSGNYVGEWTTDLRWSEPGETGSGYDVVCLQDIYDRYPNYKVRLSVYARSGNPPDLYEASNYKMYNSLANYGEPKKIKILQYNIGKFNYGHEGGLSSNVLTKINNYKKFFGDEQIDFACFQEYTEYIDANNTYKSDDTLMNYVYNYSSHFEREKIIKSNYKLYNSFFSYLHVTEEPPSDMIRCDTRVNKKPIAIITGVLNVFATLEQKLASIEKFITLNESRKNVIACFDTNVLSATEAVAVQNKFASGGYKSANWDYFGYKDTYNLSSDMYHAIDNIFVKGDIKITNVKVPNVYTTLSSDHFPFIIECNVL